MDSRIAYIDASSGISGDMLLGSLISAGTPHKKLEFELKRALKFREWKLTVKQVTRHGSPATHVDVEGGAHTFPHPKTLQKLINDSSLPAQTKKTSLSAISRLILAESKAHKIKPDNVHFHELASVDTIIDIAGTGLAFHWLKVDGITASPLNTGQTAPATSFIISRFKVPVYNTTIPRELVTPTGAALISVLAKKFGRMPKLTIESSGFGAGTMDLKATPNVLRLIIGRTD